MKREDVLKVDELKVELSGALRSLERSLHGVFGELVYAVDTVIDRYNSLETRLDILTERLVALERLRDNGGRKNGPTT